MISKITQSGHKFTAPQPSVTGILEIFSIIVQ